MNGRRCTLTFSHDSIVRLKFCLGYRKFPAMIFGFIANGLGTPLRSTCGHWAVSSSNSFSAFLCSPDPPNTTKWPASQRCLASRRCGCWKWASSLGNSSRRRTMTSADGRTSLRAWSSTRASTIPRSSRARNTSRLRLCQKLFAATPCLGRT